MSLEARQHTVSVFLDPTSVLLTEKSEQAKHNKTQRVNLGLVYETPAVDDVGLLLPNC